MCPGRSRSDAEHLMTIARQPDPDAAYDRRLGKQKEYVERHWRKKLGAPPLKAEDAPPSEAEDASEITDQTPAEPEFFRRRQNPSRTTRQPRAMMLSLTISKVDSAN